MVKSSQTVAETPVKHAAHSPLQMDEATERGLADLIERLRLCFRDAVFTISLICCHWHQMLSTCLMMQ